MPETIVDEIRAYNARIIASEVSCNFASCPKCGGTPECFKLHEVRARSFRLVRERSVLKLDSFVCRWKCPLCKRTTIDYPPFALPYKRYVKATVLGFSAKYLYEDTASYRQVTLDDGRLATFYDSPGPDDIDERQMAPSTIHRWITSLSGLPRTVRATCQLIREKSSTSDLFRRFLPVPAWKVRSDERGKLLGSCLRLVLAEVEFRKLFNVSIFPRLATANAWG